MNAPEQCGKCRHIRYRGEEALCRIRKLQHCEREEGVQTLSLKPGPCLLLNPDNACDQYASPGFFLMYGLFTPPSRTIRLVLLLLAVLLAALIVNAFFPGLLWKRPFMPWVM